MIQAHPGLSLAELCAPRKLTWLMRECSCSRFVPLGIKTGPAVASLDIPNLVGKSTSTASAPLVAVTVAIHLGPESGDDAWMTMGNALLLRLLTDADNCTAEDWALYVLS